MNVLNIFTDMAAVARRIAEISGQAPADGWQLPAMANEQPALAAQTRRPNVLPPPQIEQLVHANANAWGVDPALVKAIIANESAFDASATSKTGAQGLMQLEPQTAEELGVGNAYDPAQNIWGGTRYVRGLLERFHGDVRLAVAAYNAGPGAVEKYGGVPPYAQTQAYVDSVLESYRKYKTH